MPRRAPALPTFDARSSTIARPGGSTSSSNAGSPAARSTRHALTDRIKTLPFDLFRHEAMMTLQPVGDAVLLEIVDDIFLPLVTPMRS